MCVPTVVGSSFTVCDLYGAASRLSHDDSFYQLAFFTPGISPADAISRNWIRDSPN